MGDYICFHLRQTNPENHNSVTRSHNRFKYTRLSYHIKRLEKKLTPDKSKLHEAENSKNRKKSNFSTFT